MALKADETVEFEPKKVKKTTLYRFEGHDHILAVVSPEPGSADEREYARKIAHKLWGSGRKNTQVVTGVAPEGGSRFYV